MTVAREGVTEGEMNARTEGHGVDTADHIK